MIPVGVCVKTEKGYFYISGDAARLRITSPRVLKSWNFSRVWPCKESDLKRHVVLGTLGFRAGTVIKDYGTKQEYIIDKSRRYRISSPEFYRENSFPKKFHPLWVSSKEANLHKDGGDV